MKVFVMYDATGRIHGTFIPSRPGRRLELRSPDGLDVHTFEAKDIADQTERQHYLADLHQNHHVSMASGQPELMRQLPSHSGAK